MISGAAGNLLVRPLVEQVLAAGGTKAALTALLEQDPGDLVVSMLDEYLPHTEEDGMHVTLSGIDATLWHADGKVHGTASVSGLSSNLFTLMSGPGNFRRIESCNAALSRRDSSEVWHFTSSCV